MSLLVRFSTKRFVQPLKSTICCSRHMSQDQENVTLKKPVSAHYDIIIAGGGLVGTALGCALARNSIIAEKKVLLLEGTPPFKGFAGGEYSNRVSAISHGSIELFKSIGAWDKISSTRCKPVKQMQIWDGSSNASITFNHEDFKDDLAYIIENDLMLDAIYKQLETAQNLTIRNSTKVDTVELRMKGHSKNVVHTKDGDSISCDLLIGADGAYSAVRQNMPINCILIDYDQMGVVATLEFEDAKENTVAWQRFIPGGPIALLPLNDTMSSLVWSTTPEKAKMLLRMDQDSFVSEINEALFKNFDLEEIVTDAVIYVRSILGKDTIHNRQFPHKVKSVVKGSRAAFPFGFIHASTYVSTGIALIGDAAHRIHPLAGQGVNLGFSDVKYFIKHLSEGIYAGAEIGDKQHLIKYERCCLAKNVPLMMAVHGLQNIYKTDLSPLVLIRSLGLEAVQNTPKIKKALMDRAMS